MAGILLAKQAEHHYSAFEKLRKEDSQKWLLTKNKEYQRP